MGIMISEPRPEAVNTGSSARMVVAVVITAGRMRLSPASSTAARISFTLPGVLAAKLCSR